MGLAVLNSFRPARTYYGDTKGSGLMMYRDRTGNSYADLKVLKPGVLSDTARLADSELLAINGAEILSADTGQLWTSNGSAWNLGSATVSPAAARNISADIRKLLDFWKLPFKARASMVARGATSFMARTNLANAVSVSGSDGAALLTAMTLAATSTNVQGRIVNVDHDINLTANVAQPDDIILISTNGSKITTSGDFGITLGNRSTTAGLDFEVACINFKTTGMYRPKVIGCRFTNCTSVGAIRDSSTGDNTLHFQMTFALNEFVNCSYAMYLQRVRKAFITSNKITNPAATNRGIFFVGSEESLVEYNMVSGGIVGIGALVDRSISRAFRGNVIRRNFVTTISEEAISIDTYGNLGDKMAVFDVCNVSATSGSTGASPSIIIDRTASTGLQASTQAIFVLNGTLAGKMYPINFVAVQSAGVSVRLQMSNGSITAAELTAIVGSKIAIVVPITDNVITENTVLDAFTPIALWGCGHNTLVSNNLLRSRGTNAAISASSLGGLTITGALSAAAGEGVSPVANVTIVGNDVNDRIVLNGVSYGPEASLLDRLAPFPMFVSGNSREPTIINWARGTGSPYVSTLAPATVTNDGTVFDAETSTGWLAVDMPGAVVSQNSPAQNSGTFVASGDGTAVAFNIPHSLGVIPTAWSVTPGNAASLGAFFVTANVNNLVVTYSLAPANGSNNISLNWLVQF